MTAKALLQDEQDKSSVSFDYFSSHVLVRRGSWVSAWETRNHDLLI